jgi:hypothetical protein
LWLAAHVKKLLGPLQDLEKGEGLEGMGRGIAFQVAESLGVSPSQLTKLFKQVPAAWMALNRLRCDAGLVPLK